MEPRTPPATGRNRHLDIAELLIAGWAVAGEGDRIPATPGVLDRALHTVARRGGLPPWWRETLHFIDAQTGLRCAKLPSILLWANRAQIACQPDPEFLQVLISRRAARKILSDLGVSEEEGARYGAQLRRAACEEKESARNHPAS